MKKNVIIRSLIGAPIGLAISTVITIIVSLFMRDGAYYPVVPELAADLGTEINAVIVQAVFAMLYGAAYGGASVIWDTEWSLTKMTAAHLVICSLATFPTAWLMRWMERSWLGVIRYFGIFILIYIIIWFSQYSSMKRKINEINHKVQASE